MTTSEAAAGAPVRGALALLAGAALAGFDAGAVGFVLPALRAATGADAAAASVVVWVYVLGTLVAIAAGGWATSHWAPARLLRVSLVLALAGALGSALGQGLTQLALARLLQGLGQGPLLPLAATLVAARWPPGRQGRLNGALSLAYGVSFLGATQLAPWLLAHGGWQAGFGASAAVAALALAGSVHLPPGRVARPPPGAAPRRWWRGEMLALGAIALGTGLGQAVLVWLPTVAQARLAVSPQHSGLLMLPLVVGGLSSTAAITLWLDRVGPRLPIAAGAALTLAGVALVSLAPATLPCYAAGTAALGLGVTALCGGPLRVVATQSRPGPVQGRAQAAVALLTNVGLLAGSVMLGQVAALAAGDREGVEWALGAAAVGMLPCFAAFAGLRRRPG
ncbi:MAG: MFS transporter [Rubrivivax sp.]